MANIITGNKGFHPAVYDDVQAPAISSYAYSGASPAFSLLKNDGAAGGSGYAVSFDGANDYGVIPDGFGDFSTSWSIVFWISNRYTGGADRFAFHKATVFNVAIGNTGRVRFNLQGFATIQTTAALPTGTKTMVTITVSEGATTTDVKIYFNTTLDTNTTLAGTLAADNTNDLYVGANSTPGSYLNATLDEIRIYQNALTSADISELYASGVGVETEPTSTPTLLVGFHMNEGSGTTCDNYQGDSDHDMTLYNSPTWVTGLVTSTHSRGVFTWMFQPDSDDELHFSCQLPHGYKIGTTLLPHIHWCPLATDAGNIVWGLEYTVAGISGVFGNTVVQTKTVAAGTAYTHYVTSFDTAIPSTGLTISSMVIGRIYRQGTSGSDTAACGAALLQFDLHMQLDQLGSRQENVK